MAASEARTRYHATGAWDGGPHLAHGMEESRANTRRAARTGARDGAEPLELESMTTAFSFRRSTLSEL